MSPLGIANHVTRGRYGLHCGVLVVFVLIARPGASVGQSPETQPTASQPAASQPSENLAALTRAEVQARLSRIERATDIPENVKVESVGLYRQALDQMALSETWRQKTEQYRKGREESPGLLAAIREHLKQLSVQVDKPPHIDLEQDAPREQLTQRLTAAEAELKGHTDTVRTLDEEAAQRRERRAAIPDLLAAATGRLEAANRALAESPATGVAPEVQLARRTLNTAQRIAAGDEVRGYQEELQFYDARSDLLAARRDEARMQVAIADSRLSALRALMAGRRDAETATQLEEAKDELSNAPDPVRAIAEKNVTLAQEWDALGGKIMTAERSAESIRKRADSLSSEFNTLKTQAELAEMADLVGPLLRQQRAELVPLRRIEHDLEETRADFARIQLRVNEIEDEGNRLLNRDEVVQSWLTQLAEGTGQLTDKELTDSLGRLADSRREILKKLKRDYDAYSADLIDLATAQSSLLARAGQIEAFIEERVLWTPSALPIYKLRFPTEADALVRAAGDFVRALWTDIVQNLWAYSVALLMFALLLSQQVRLRRDLRKTGELVAKAASDRYVLTLKALFDTLVIALPVPLLFWLGGNRVQRMNVRGDPAAFELARAVGTALITGGVVLFPLIVVRQACRRYGIAACHFRWDVAGLLVIRRHLIWFIPLITPMAVIVAMCESFGDPAWGASVGRLAFIAAMGGAAAFVLATLHPERGALANYFRKRPAAFLTRVQWPLFVSAALVPFAFAVLSAWGFHYTAIELSRGLLETFALTLALLLVHAMAMRGVFYAQRKLALAEARQKSAEQAAAAEGEKPKTDVTIDESKLKLVTIGDQTRRLLSGFAWFGAILILWISWADLIPALSFLDDVTLWSYTSQVASLGDDGGGAAGTRTVIESITLANVLLAVLVLFVTFLFARNTPGLLEILFLRRLSLDAGARFAITTISRYVLLVVGFVVAFGTIGVGWSNVQWLIAAITVGLGFGLQEIFANFISGIILLFERPIRLGDTVTVGGITGTVSRMRIRATTITDWDRKELVIPNKEFVTGQIVNWSLSDRILRLTVKVGIAYGSDVGLAKELLLDKAHGNTRVLAEPKPHVWFMEFGDSSLNLELRAFVKDIDDYLLTRDALHVEIDNVFREAGIEIAFPQQDIHVRSFPNALPVDSTSSIAQDIAPERSVRAASDPVAGDRGNPGKDDTPAP